MKNVSIRGPIKDFRTNLSSFFTGFHFQSAKLLDFCQKSNVAFFVLKQAFSPPWGRSCEAGEGVA